MKNLPIALFIFITFFVLSSIFAQTPNQHPQNWKLIFEDHFNNDLNPEVWRKRNNYDHGGEPQMYTDRKKNSRVEDGKLIIECHREDYKDHKYTSAYVDLRKDYLYGYFEIRCKQPLGKGLWPAFWFSSATSTKDGWPPEIDIFETNGKDASFTSGGIHMKENGTPIKVFHFEDYKQSINEWQTFAIDWSPDIINWYVDDKLVGSTTMYIPQILRRLVINLALFPWDQPDDNADYFPARFEIDYIKIWERVDGCPYLSWKQIWTSQPGYNLDDWLIKEQDKYISGNFLGNSKDELLIINNKSKEYGLFIFKNLRWENILKGYDIIGENKIRSSNEVLSCKFSNESRSEFIILDRKENNISIQKYKSISKQFVESYSIDLDQYNVKLSEETHFFVGDFNGDGYEKIFLKNPDNEEIIAFFYNNKTKAVEQKIYNKEYINWKFSISDEYIVGDYSGDGKDQLFLINRTSKQAKLFNLEDQEFVCKYDNQNTQKIASWVLNKDDIYLIGDFDNSGKDEILFINPRSKYSRILKPEVQRFIWSNSGNVNKYYWNLNPNLGDKYISGKFDNKTKNQVFVTRFSNIENKAFTKYANSLKSKMFEFMECKEE